MKRFPHWALVPVVALGALRFGLMGLLVTATAVVCLELALSRARLVDLRPVSRRRWAWRQRSPARADLLSRIRDEIAWSSHSIREFDRTLCPRLRRIAEMQLRRRHAVDVAASPAAARAALGEESWRILDPARPATLDRDAPGLDLVRLDRVVGSLEGRGRR